MLDIEWADTLREFVLDIRLLHPMGRETASAEADDM